MDVHRSTGYTPTLKLQDCVALWHQRCPLHAKTGTILEDVGVLVSWLRHSYATDASLFSHIGIPQTWISPLLHQCLMLKPLERAEETSASCGQMLQEAIRLAVIMFLAPVRRAFRVMTGEATVLATNLRAALEQCPKEAWIGFETLQLWIISVSGMEIVSTSRDASINMIETRSWFCQEMASWRREAGSRADDTTRDTMIDMLRGFAWIEAIHDAPFTQLMDACETCTQ